MVARSGVSARVGDLNCPLGAQRARRSACTTASACSAPTAASVGRNWPRTVGVHPQTIGYVQRGEDSPSLALALRIARCFDLPVEALFSLDPMPPLSQELLRRTS